MSRPDHAVAKDLDKMSGKYHYYHDGSRVKFPDYWDQMDDEAKQAFLDQHSPEHASPDELKNNNARAQEWNEKENPHLIKHTISFKGVPATDKSSFRFPSDKPITSSTDYVSFEFFQYDPPFGKGSNRGGSGANDPKKDPESLGSQTLFDKYNESIGGNTDVPKKKSRWLKNIILYMPEDIGSQYGANWGGAGFGIGMQSFARAIGGAGDIGDLGANIQGDLGRLGNKLVGGAKITGYKSAATAMNKALGGNVTANQLMSSVSGTIINPNVETLYESPELRGFNLNFKMMAKSSAEGLQIRQICKQFKKAMLPSWGGQTMGGALESGALLTVPEVCKVRFMTGGEVNPFVSQFKTCAITAVNINNTPDGAWATYMGGEPVATELSLQFKELKLIFADEIHLGNGPSY